MCVCVEQEQVLIDRERKCEKKKKKHMTTSSSPPITPKKLHLLSATGRTKRLERLLSKAGRDLPASLIDEPDSDGDTPLHLAAANGHTKAIHLLVQRGANTNKKDAQGNSPLYLAAQEGHVNAVAVLVKFFFFF